MVAIVRAHQHNDNPNAGPMLSRLRSTGGVVDAWEGTGMVFTFLSGSEIPGLGFNFDSHGLLLLDGEHPSDWRPLHCSQRVPGAMMNVNGRWHGGIPGAEDHGHDHDHDHDDVTTQGGEEGASEGGGSDNDDDDDGSRPELSPQYEAADSIAYEAELEAAQEIEKEKEEWAAARAAAASPGSEDPANLQLTRASGNNEDEGAESELRSSSSRKRTSFKWYRPGERRRDSGNNGAASLPRLGAPDGSAGGWFLAPPGEFSPVESGPGLGRRDPTGGLLPALQTAWSIWRSRGQEVPAASRKLSRSYRPTVGRACHLEHALVCRPLPWLGQPSRMPVSLQMGLTKRAASAWAVEEQLEAERLGISRPQHNNAMHANQQSGSEPSPSISMLVVRPTPGQVLEARSTTPSMDPSGGMLLAPDRNMAAVGTLHLVARLSSDGAAQLEGP